MTTVQKAIAGVIAVAMITTAVYPGRNTAQVIGATSKLATGTLSTAIGTSSGAVGG